MNTLVVDKNLISLNQKSYRIEDLMDKDFYKYSDDIAAKYSSNLIYGNEIYYTFIQQVLSLRNFIQKNRIEEIKVVNNSFFIHNIVKSAGACATVKVTSNPLRDYGAWLLNKIKNMVYMFVSVVYLALRTLSPKYTGRPSTDSNCFSIVRLNQEYNKFEFLREDGRVYFDYENIRSTLEKNKVAVKNGIVYNRFKRSERFIWLVKSVIQGVKNLNEINKFCTEKVNKQCAAAACSFYSKRIMHTAYYENMINKYFSIFSGKKCVTGKIIDRYGFLEKKYCKKYGIQLINIPHGIEYGFKMPNGLVGNIFYATSKNAADLFNQQYSTNRFIFNNSIQQKTLCRNYSADSKYKKVVFFTEAHEPEVNSLIIEELISTGIDLIVKPHPKEHLSFYDKFKNKIKIELSFDYAITNSICIARRSSVLIEAIYNHSVPCAIITNISDGAIFENYPSLNDSRIHIFYAVNDLISFIDSVGECDEKVL